MKRLKFLILFLALFLLAGAAEASRVVINGIPYEQFSRLILPKSTTVPTTCQSAEIYIDTDATSGSQLYICESGTFVLSSPTAGGGLTVSTSNFDGILSATEDTIQKALDALDDFTDVKTDLNAPNGKLTAGTQGAATNGNLWLYGSTAVSGAGGQLVLYNAATYYDTEPGFIIQPVDGNLEIGPSGDTNALTWIQATGKWQIDGNVGGVELLHAGTKVFETTSTGAGWLSDTLKAYFGAGTDASIEYDSDELRITSDLVAASDIVIDAGTEKTLVLAEPVWDDVVIPMAATKLGGANAAAEIAYRGGLAVEFVDTSDTYIYVTIQLPHTYKEGTDIDFHLHWTLDGDGGEGGAGTENIGWIATSSNSSPTAAGTETWPGETTHSEVVVDVNDWDQHEHHLTDIATVSGTGMTASEVILISFYRNASVSNDSTLHAIVVSVDAHFQVDTMGSRTEHAK